MEHTTQHQDHVGQSRMGGFHRHFQRREVSGYTCDIADSRRLIGAVVENVSANGFKVSRIGEGFLAAEHCYRTVISGNGKHFKILAKPCWKRQTSQGVEIGFKILDVSWEWLEMTLSAGSEKKPRLPQTANA